MPTPHTQRRQDLLAASLLILLNSLWLFTLTFGFFTVDDADYVSLNSHVLHGLTLENMRWAFTDTHLGFWLPLTWLSLQLNSSLLGTLPWSYHLGNVLFHILNTLLLYAFFRRLTSNSPAPSSLAQPPSHTNWQKCLLAAALFSIHPQRVESVAWITERKDVLAFFFGILALHAYLSYARSPSLRRYCLLIASFLASLLCKPMLVMLPAALLLLDYWPLHRFQKQRPWPLLKEKIPLLILSLAICLDTCLIQYAVGYLASFSLAIRLQNTLLDYFLYLRDFFDVSRLVIIHYPRLQIPPWQIAASTLFFLAVPLSMLLLLRRKNPAAKPLLVGYLWFIIILFPMSGIVISGYNVRADRFTYFPEIGLVLALVWGIIPLLRLDRLPAALTRPTAVLLIAFVASLTVQRLMLWKDPLILFEHDLKLEENASLHQMAGLAAAADGLTQKSLAHLRRAAQLEPGLLYLYQNALSAQHPATPPTTAPNRRTRSQAEGLPPQ